MPSAATATAAAAPAAAAAAPALSDPRLRPTTLAAERALAVPTSFQALLPGGLPRGVTIAVHGVPAPAFALALLGPATRQGSWLAIVGLDELGWVAAAELGVELGRTVAVHPVPADAWAPTLAALFDGFDAVLVGPGPHVAPSLARRLSARARERAAVLIRLCDGPGSTDLRAAEQAWGPVNDMVVQVDTPGWEGLEHGVGRLSRRHVRVSLEGRRVPGRRRRAELWLPAESGAPSPAAGPPAPTAPGAPLRVVPAPGRATSPPEAVVP